MRYARSSNEEIWVMACAKFFERHGDYDWYKVDQHQAYTIMAVTIAALMFLLKGVLPMLM